MEMISSYASLLCWLTASTLTVVGSAITCAFFRKAPLSRPARPEGISILKPLKGFDRDTEANLESFFHLNYPEYELLFSVADARDPVIKIVERLRRRFPHVKAALFVKDSYVGPNPKINNLLVPYAAARYSSVLISDSNIRVPRDYLLALAADFEGRTMICSVVSGIQAESFAGKLEEIFLSTFYSRPGVTSAAIGHPYMTGKSLLFRRDYLDRMGGLEILRNHLAEDMVIGEKFREQGLPTALARVPVTQVIGAPTLSQFWARHVRWGLIRKAHAPLAFVLEIFLTNAFVAAAIGSLALEDFTGVPAIYLFSATLASWCAFDLSVMRSMGSRLTAATPALWMIREFLHIPLWLNIAATNSVMWKGRTWKIRRDGTLAETGLVPLEGENLAKDANHCPWPQNIGA